MKSAWGSDDPTKAAFPFLHGHALAEGGHTVQILPLGEAVSLMRLSLAKAVVPVGWPPLEETLQKVVARKIQIFACGACSRARGVTDADLAQWGAKFGNPTIFVSLVEWADRIITECRVHRRKHRSYERRARTGPANRRGEQRANYASRTCRVRQAAPGSIEDRWPRRLSDAGIG